MSVDPVVLLGTVAKQFGMSVRKINLFDANVCTSPPDLHHPWEHLPLPGDIFRHKVDITFAAHKIRLRANGEFVVAEVPSNLDVDVLSLNRQDKVFQLEPCPFKIPSFPSLEIFASSKDDNLRQFLASPSLSFALSTLRLKQDESLHIYRNGPVLYLKPASPDEVLSAVKTLCDLVDRLPSFNDSVDLEGLPAEFKKLSSLIREWAEPDDEIRSELLGQKSEAALRKFVAAVEPHIPAINEYLDSFREQALPEAAVALGRLAECATEARLILENPKS
jgi:hypothetical protein